MQKRDYKQILMRILGQNPDAKKYNLPKAFIAELLNVSRTTLYNIETSEAKINKPLKIRLELLNQCFDIMDEKKNDNYDDKELLSAAINTLTNINNIQYERNEELTEEIKINLENLVLNQNEGKSKKIKREVFIVANEEAATDLDNAIFLKTAMWLKKYIAIVIDSKQFFEYLKHNDLPDVVISIGGPKSNYISELFSELTLEIDLSNDETKEIEGAKIKKSEDGNLWIIYEQHGTHLRQLLKYFVSQFFSS